MNITKSLLLELLEIFSILNLEYNFKSFYQPGEIVCLLLPLLTDALILLLQLLSNNNTLGNQNRKSPKYAGKMPRTVYISEQ